MKLTPVSYTHLGHVRDLPKSQLGIDIENDYEPKYITIRGKGELLSALRKEAKNADKIYPVSYTHLDVYKRQ